VKRSVFILIALLMVSAIMIPACGKGTPTPPPPPTEEPQYGGIMRCAFTFGPRILGYFPEFGFTDGATAWYYAESMLNVDEKGNLIPELATSWDVDATNKTITWHLRQGVKFHDGTDWNAEAAKWTYDKTIEAGKLQSGNLITSIEVIDDYTLRFNLTQFSNRLLMSYGYMVFFFSPTAFETNGGKEWARTHPVGTGPFKVTEFKRDAYIKMEKNTDYWRPNRPYLDGVDIRMIPQELTGAASMEAGEIDYWQSATTATMILEMRDKGYKDEISGLTLGFLMPDAANPDSPFADKRVREAVEYAIDRPTMVQALSLGLSAPSFQLAVSISSVYDPDYKGRPYDPEKAKKLLAEAGYSDGCPISLFAIQMGTMDQATALKNYLDAGGFVTKIEGMDMGRFMTMQSDGWKNGLMSGLVFAPQPNFTSSFLQALGPTPTSPVYPSFLRTPEYQALCEQANSAYDLKTEEALVKKMIKLIAEDATIIPTTEGNFRPIMQTWVHPMKDKESGIVRFTMSEWWMEPH